MKNTKEPSFLKSLPSLQPKQLSLAFPTQCTWERGNPAQCTWWEQRDTNYYGKNYPAQNQRLKPEWNNLLQQINVTKSTTPLTLSLDFNYMSLEHIIELLKIIQVGNAHVKEVAIHNIEALLAYSLDRSLSSGITKQNLSKSVIPSKSIFTKLVQDEQKALVDNVKSLVGKASKVNLTNLPLGSSTCDTMFNILNNLTCSELEISSNNMDISIAPSYLHFFISKNKNITKLDISKICQMYENDTMSEAIIFGCVENPKIEVKYSSTLYAANYVPLNLRPFFELSVIRMDTGKKDFIKSLLQVANKLCSHNFPQEIVTHIIKDYVDPNNYIATCFQPDGQHITPLLGCDRTDDTVSELS